MTRKIEKRLEKIEKMFSVDKKCRMNRIVIVLNYPFSSSPADKTLIESLGAIEQWETYKQTIAQNPESGILVFQAVPQLELEARQRPLTKDEIAALLCQPCIN